MASPAASCASSTTGSVTGTPRSTRPPSDTWQPMIGCTPLAVQYWENSSAPNRLPLSAIATAGIDAACASAAISATRIAPWLSE